MFVGREEELKLLEQRYCSDRSELVIIYGRRRVGKSALIYKFLESKKKAYLYEGLEDEPTSVQIEELIRQLKKQFNDPYLGKLRFSTWSDVFSYMTDRFFSQTGKKILVLDEFQWIASGYKRVVSLLKSYWDKHWKHQNVMLILCGSVASFMVDKVINSKALYGRINLEILLKPLYPNEAKRLFKKRRSDEEILKYMMVYGCIPRYLEEINLNQSFKQNINQMCFTPKGVMVNEAERIFYNQFRESENYKRIVRLVRDQPCTFKTISEKLSMVSGGGLKRYLTNLEKAELIKSYVSFDMSKESKFRKYKLIDEFLVFFYKFMDSNLDDIKEYKARNLFNILVEPHWKPWLGYAFERFCFRNAYYLAERMGFIDEVISVAPYFEKRDQKFQIDLIYKRADKTLVVCELKYHDKEIGSEVVLSMSHKLDALKIPRGYSVERALVSQYGPNRSLKESGYFHHYLDISSLF